MNDIEDNLKNGNLAMQELESSSSYFGLREYSADEIERISKQLSNLGISGVFKYEYVGEASYAIPNPLKHHLDRENKAPYCDDLLRRTRIAERNNLITSIDDVKILKPSYEIESISKVKVEFELLGEYNTRFKLSDEANGRVEIDGKDYIISYLMVGVRKGNPDFYIFIRNYDQEILNEILKVFSGPKAAILVRPY